MSIATLAAKQAHRVDMINALDEALMEPGLTEAEQLKIYQERMNLSEALWNDAPKLDGAAKKSSLLKRIFKK